MTAVTGRDSAIKGPPRTATRPRWRVAGLACGLLLVLTGCLPDLSVECNAHADCPVERPICFPGGICGRGDAALLDATARLDAEEPRRDEGATPVDRGIDATPRLDGVVADQGSPLDQSVAVDARGDAARPVDAGTTDAAPGDAISPDADRVDARPSDAAPVDQGPHPLDARPADAEVEMDQGASDGGDEPDVQIDRGILDAEPVDAREDLGFVPLPDLGRVDAAPEDAEPVDALAPDSVVPDSGVPDAEPPDACVPDDEICDGVDNDCDGQIDEGEDGEPLRRTCVGAPGQAAADCLLYFQVCTDGAFDGPCRNEDGGAPALEVCDGIDNDCDGEIDEGPGGGPITEACYDGPVGTRDEGECRDGVRSCVGGMMGACEGWVGPQREICNGLDDSCDGFTDVGADGVGRPCAVGLGECRVESLIACVSSGGGASLVCPVNPGPIAPEVCNGLDDDCDGVVDNDVPSGGACMMPAGAFGDCAGTLVCMDGIDKCVPVPRPDVAERCNSLDDDCDGAVDEDFPEVGDACEGEVGACETRGRVICAADGLGTRCQLDADPPEPEPETCDGVDNDCDGEVDEAPGDVCAASGAEAVCLHGACADWRCVGRRFHAPDGIEAGCFRACETDSAMTVGAVGPFEPREMAAIALSDTRLLVAVVDADGGLWVQRFDRNGGVFEVGSGAAIITPNARYSAPALAAHGGAAFVAARRIANDGAESLEVHWISANAVVPLTLPVGTTAAMANAALTARANHRYGRPGLIASDGSTNQRTLLRLFYVAESELGADVGDPRRMVELRAQVVSASGAGFNGSNWAVAGTDENTDWSRNVEHAISAEVPPGGGLGAVQVVGIRRPAGEDEPQRVHVIRDSDATPREAYTANLLDGDPVLAGPRAAYRPGGQGGAMLRAVIGHSQGGLSVVAHSGVSASPLVVHTYPSRGRSPSVSTLEDGFLSHWLEQDPAGAEEAPRLHTGGLAADGAPTESDIQHRRALDARAVALGIWTAVAALQVNGELTVYLTQCR